MIGTYRVDEIRAVRKAFRLEPDHVSVPLRESLDLQVLLAMSTTRTCVQENQNQLR